MTSTPPSKPARRRMRDSHRRLLVAVIAGVVAGFGTQFTAAPTSSHILIGWNAGAICYLVMVWRLFLTADGATVQRLSKQEDEKRSVLLGIVLSLVAASLVAVVQAMIVVKDEPPWERSLIAGLAGLTLVTSWMLLQSVFVLHYAHRHFADADGKGFDFPGEPASDYLDFVYLSFCIGATFQVSDTTVKTARLRRLITAHAATAYAFNTAILALGINIIAGLVGKS